MYFCGEIRHSSSPLKKSIHNVILNMQKKEIKNAEKVRDYKENRPGVPRAEMRLIIFVLQNKENLRPGAVLPLPVYLKVSR